MDAGQRGIARHTAPALLKKGEKITKSNIRRIRPGYGLSPKYIDQIINRKVNKNIYKGDRVTWEVIDKN